MAVLSYNEILPKCIINYNNEPYEVLSAHIFRMQQRKPVNQTKLRQLVGGKEVIADVVRVLEALSDGDLTRTRR